MKGNLRQQYRGLVLNVFEEVDTADRERFCCQVLSEGEVIDETVLARDPKQAIRYGKELVDDLSRRGDI
jgi:hypothetical protein